MPSSPAPNSSTDRSVGDRKRILPQIARARFATPAEQRLISQTQGRTYANMFALVERFIAARMMEVGRGHALGDQVAMESLVRLTDEELKHQTLFRRPDGMMEAGMPAGYGFVPEASDVAGFVLSKCDWAVLALTCHIEMFSIRGGMKLPCWGQLLVPRRLALVSRCLAPEGLPGETTGQSLG